MGTQNNCCHAEMEKQHLGDSLHDVGQTTFPSPDALSAQHAVAEQHDENIIDAPRP